MPIAKSEMRLLYTSLLYFKQALIVQQVFLVCKQSEPLRKYVCSDSVLN